MRKNDRMTENKNINLVISGIPVELRRLSRNEMKSVYIGAQIRYDFYQFSFKTAEMVLLWPRSPKLVVTSALSLVKESEILSRSLEKPCVFYFDTLDYNRRIRLVEKNVFFIVGNEYAYLPMLMSYKKIKQPVDTSTLQPCAQYMILRQLESSDINNLTLSELEKILPFGYVTITRAVRQLHALKLIAVIADRDTKEKQIRFNLLGRELWQASEKHLASPIKKVLFSDVEPPLGLPAGIEALSHYSALNPDWQHTVAITKEQYTSVREALNTNPDKASPYRIEVWAYPPIPSGKNIVDKLSLYLSLKNDPDPRVEKELEIMINRLW